MEQKRAKHAWQMAMKNKNDRYKNLAKGAPAMIMGNGLMPSLAFWQSKKAEEVALVSSLLDWLKDRRFLRSSNFNAAMEEMQGLNSERYMGLTQEALDYLKWLRNFVGAVEGASKGEK